MSTETALTGYRLGYARVSTLEQNEALQRDAHDGAGCDRIYVDRTSGKLDSRPALDAMLEQLRPSNRRSA
jgi:DNA invertase Pin-like site-specific DNA recombinase